MANLQFAHSSAPLKTIQEIQFGLFSPEDVKNMSVAHIIYPETMVGVTRSDAQARKLTYYRMNRNSAHAKVVSVIPAWDQSTVHFPAQHAGRTCTNVPGILAMLN